MRSRKNLARHPQQAEYVDVELADHFLVGAVLDRGKQTKAGIVHQNVDAARLGDDPRHPASRTEPGSCTSSRTGVTGTPCACAAFSRSLSSPRIPAKT
nr:hypothetical protein [Paracoccus alkenifer]